MANEWVVRKGLIVKPFDGLNDEIVIVGDDGKIITNGVTLQSITGDISQLQTDVPDISGNLQSQIDNNYSVVENISGNFVLKSGDTMTGTLTMDSGTDITLSGDNNDNIRWGSKAFAGWTDATNSLRIFAQEAYGIHLYSNGVTQGLTVDTSNNVVIDNELIVDDSLHVSTNGNNSSSDAGVHIHAAGQSGSSTTGGIVLTQQNIGDRRLYWTGNDGGFSWNVGSYNPNEGELQMSIGQVAVAAEFRMGPEGERVMRSTDQTCGFAMEVDVDLTAHDADTDTDAYHTYMRTQDGGPLSVASGTNGGDLVLTLGAGIGDGDDGRFIVNGAIQPDDIYLDSLTPSLSGNFLTWNGSGKIVDTGISSSDISGGGSGTGFTPLEGEGITITSSGSDYVFSVDDYISSSEVENISSNLITDIENLDISLTSLIVSVSGDLQTQIDNISGGAKVYQGMVDCNTTDQIYSITHSNIDVNEVYAQVSLTIPTSGDTLFLNGITNRTSTSFDVVLSGVPNASGYGINWLLVSGTNGVGPNGLIDEIGTGTQTITAHESIVPDMSGVYDLGSIDKPWRELYITGNTMYMGGKPISINGNRLTFDSQKTLAFTDEVTGSVTYLQGEIDKVATQTANVSANSGLEKVTAMQPLHTFNVGDPVRQNVGYNGIFDTFDTHNVGDSYRLIVNENEPYSNIDGLGYKINAYGGQYYNNSYGNGFATHSKKFRNKYGDFSARFEYTGGTNSRGVMGLFIAPKDNFNNARYIIYNPGAARVFVGDYDDNFNKNDSYRSDPDSYSALDLKIESENVDGTIRVHTSFKLPENDNWVSYGYNYDTGIVHGEEYRIGIMFTGGSQSYGTTRYRLTANILDIDGSLAVPNYNPVWVSAGGDTNKSSFADGIVNKIINDNIFEVATAGILNIEGFFSAGVDAYLNQQTSGRITYNKPTVNPQLLYKGIDSNNGKLILSDGAAGTNIEDDGSTISLTPDTSAAYLGSESDPWKKVYTNEIIINGVNLFEEGGISPSLAGSITPGTVSYTTQNGNYQKMGNWVHFSITVDVSSYSGISGYIRLSGIPYSSESGCNYSLNSTDQDGFDIDLYPVIIGGTQYIQLQDINGNVITDTSITGNPKIIISGSYKIG